MGKDLAQERWVERTFTICLDEGTYGDSPDEDEICYLLRMGGIDAATKDQVEDWGCEIH